MSFSKILKMIWNDLDAAIKANQSFLLSSHLSPDGDAIGSQLAFYWYLESLGKNVTMFNQDPIPAKFRFLKYSDLSNLHKPSDKFDIVIVLDCSNPGRLGWDGVMETAPFIINFDHHRDNSHFGKINIVKTDAAATGELIYQFFVQNKIDFPPDVAEALYTAIMTDTGGFRFSNTNSRVLRTCADLSDRGADCARIYDKVYTSHSAVALNLQAKIWSTLAFYLDNHVCCMNMPLSLLNKLGAQYSDSEGMADYTITATGVDVGIMAKHTDNETHFSLRSRGRIDVGKIAQKVKGGGGHSCAAGCTIPEPYSQALIKMLKIIEKVLD